MSSVDSYEVAKQHVINQVMALGGQPTEEQLRVLVGPAIAMATTLSGEELDEERVLRLVKMQVNVLSPEARALDNPDDDHVPWLHDTRSETEWAFWERYRAWLQTKKRLPPQVVRGIDDITDDILERLENPDRRGSWDRRGLVAGQVQSGKTANYTGLICKAADAGYKLIVVLAGIHNNLRAQTQRRLDEAFIGMDSVTKRRLGVGELPVNQHPLAMSLTDSTDKGDFRLSTAQAATMQLGGQPLIVVMKKNATVLRTFLKWVTNLNQSQDSSGRQTVNDVPLLLIDDEADNASINTKDPESDPTTINSLIRDILDSFQKAAYVGYTATPFANLFIDDRAEHEVLGKDLFPRSFIVALRPPSNYIGPGDVFGMSAIPELAQVARDGLPVTRAVRDFEEWVPNKHKRDLVPGPLPVSLKSALHSFVLVIAARRARQQFDHNSMLIHVTRFNDVQRRVHEQVKDYLSEIRNLLRYGGDNSPLLHELEELWRSDFEPTSQQITTDRPDLMDGVDPVDWASVREELKTAVLQIDLRMINGLANDVLDYNSYENGLSVIAIGGDKLSRGLTLEGLSVSYYLRASRMYDTLMQMGRWFGYRLGYVDLCRMYTTDELMGWYRDIAAASEELWTEFEYMSSVKRTPEDFGLRVRSHPGGLLVTATSKMRAGERRKLSYSGALAETVSFRSAEEDRKHNLDALTTLLDPPPAPSDRHLFWTDLESKDIVEFFSALHQPDDARRARPDLIASYIRSATQRGELTDWTVVLINNSAKEARRFDARGHDIGMTKRKQNEPPEEGKFAIGRLLDPLHEALDLSDGEREQVIDTTRKLREQSGLSTGSQALEMSGRVIRSIRPKERALLLVYLLNPQDNGLPYVAFGVSFPMSEEAQPVEYVVNNVYQQLELDFDTDD